MYRKLILILSTVSDNTNCSVAKNLPGLINTVKVIVKLIYITVKLQLKLVFVCQSWAELLNTVYITVQLIYTVKL